LCIGNSTIKNHNGAKSDVIVTDNSVIFGDNIWTLQNQCHEEGEQIYMSYKSLMHQDNNEFPERFTEEWLKYRYGVFDEDGFVGDEIFPQCSHYPTTSSILKSSNSNSSNGNGNWLCQDALEIQSTLFNNEASSNNRYLPTKQNFKCHGKSKLDVVLKSTDFASYINSQPVQIHKTQFNYVRRALTRYVVIIEDHFDVNIRDSFQFMKTALRKWINIDLEQNTSEVGIVMMKQNETNIMNEIKIAKIDSSENRENVLASIPLYLDNTYKVQKNKKCSLQSYLAKSFEALKMKSRMSRSEDVIIVIAPGMYECNDENSKRIVEDIENAGIKLITINYPQIGSNRVELDRLSETIESFTIFEEKQNEERSLLNTFFDLSNTLMAISHSHSSKSDLMPVEIYRKQIGEDKNQLDSFNVDEATDDIQFFVYFYDRKERNFETNFKVTSPSNKVFEKLSEQRAEYHQLGVLGKLSEVGSWSYNIKRFFSPQPTFIQVNIYEIYLFYSSSFVIFFYFSSSFTFYFIHFHLLLKKKHFKKFYLIHIFHTF
jgi:calcium-activated chloride channel regulator 3/4